MCGGTNRQGAPCGNAAGKGTDHVGAGNCRNHGGSSPNGKKHAAVLSARQQLERLTVQPLTPDQYIDPIGALLSAVTEAAMVVNYLREQVMDLGVHLDGRAPWTHMLTTSTRSGDTIELGEEARAIVKLYGEWHDRQVKAAKACAAAKIDERVTQLAERQGAMLDTAFRLFLARMAEEHPDSFTADVVESARRVFAGAFRELATTPG